MDKATSTRHHERFLAASPSWDLLKPPFHPHLPNKEQDGPKIEAPREAPHLLSDEEAWGFEVHGFLIIRSALSSSEVAECAALAAKGVAPRALATHEVALRYVEELCRDDWRLDTPVELVTGWPEAPAAADEPRARLHGGGNPHDPGRAYHSQGRTPQGRWCQGLRVIWALTDAPSGGAGVALLPASHNLHVPIPEAVLRGEEDYLESLGIELQPQLRAGDMLLHSSALAHGLSSPPYDGATLPLLCSCNYTAVFARPSDPAADVSYSPRVREYFEGLGPAERAVLGLPAVDGSYPAVISNGTEARVETPEEMVARNNKPFHPAGLTVLAPDPELVNPMEFFYWELTGFVSGTADLLPRSCSDPAASAVCCN